MSFKNSLFRNESSTDHLFLQLKDKIEKYGKCPPNTYINDLFSYDEFERAFLLVYMQFTLCYNDIMFTLFNCGDYAEFWIDGKERDSYKKYYDSKQLLKDVKIDDKYLYQIWNSIVIAC